MQPSTTCIKCGGRMSEGALVDTGYGAYSVLSFQSGKPSVSRWFGLKVRRKELLPARVMRCERCGYLELYAAAGD